MPNAPARLERVAHRGMPGMRRENTLPSFKLALDHGADAIELDVHVTRDGVVVVHHDAAVHDRPILGLSWKELAVVDLGAGARIPRLEDVLTAVGQRAVVYVELKGSGIEEAVVATVRAHGHRFALHSFDHGAMERSARLAPEIARGVLLDRGLPDAEGDLARVVARVHPRDVWPHASLVDASFMRLARELEVRVIPWTVNSAQSARALLAIGVDAICTDDVRILVNLQ